MKILKFGGTSVGSAERICNVGRLVAGSDRKIVVLSAMSGTTNSLVEIANNLYRNDTQAALDCIQNLEDKYYGVIAELFKSEEYTQKAINFVKETFGYLRSFVGSHFYPLQEKCILAQGELLSTTFMHYHLSEIGVKNTLIPALCFMRVDKDSEPDYFYIKENLERKISELDVSDLIITQGFICRNAQGEIDNLKRGGSDYSAALMGSAIKADEIQIWTDIDGFHNNDPRFVEGTKAIRMLSFEEAAELAYFGAKILHPTTIQPAQKENIPVRLKNTLCPEDEGTLITKDSTVGDVKAVAAKDGITIVNIKSTNMLLAYGFLRKVFEVFEKWKTPIDMITTSEVAVSLTIDDATNLDNIKEDLDKYGKIAIEKNMSIICIVGDFTADKTGLAGTVLSALNAVAVKMIAYGGNEHNISVVVEENDKKQALVDLSKNLLNK